MKKVIFLSMLLAFCMLAYGQTYRIEGTVIDKTSRNHWNLSMYWLLA